MAKAVRLFISSVHSQLVCPKVCATDIFVSLRWLKCKRRHFEPVLGGLGCTWKVGIRIFNSLPMGSHQPLPHNWHMCHAKKTIWTNNQTTTTLSCDVFVEVQLRRWWTPSLCFISTPKGCEILRHQPRLLRCQTSRSWNRRGISFGNSWIEGLRCGQFTKLTCRRCLFKVSFWSSFWFGSYK